MENGHDIESNGHTNGHTNGHANGSYNAVDVRTTELPMKSLRFESEHLKEVTVVWQDIVKHVETVGPEGKGLKQVLYGISGSAKPGELIALMGPSGSGKTTLLNVLTGRANANTTGDVFLNNSRFKKSMKKAIAYVLQQDLFHLQLTVREQLKFTSYLRLPDTMTLAQKEEAAEHVIRILRMESCADTKIMLVSGGEKKRCNIGTELLTNPSVILLDEPTSGLDSNSAAALIATLRQLADERMTVISSIHQPSSKMLYTFDKLVLLADGHMVYSGSPKMCMQYLASKKYIPPADYNPADFLMDLVTSTEKTENGKSIREILIDAWDNTELSAEVNSLLTKGVSSGDDNSEDDVPDGYETTYSTQFMTLLHRSAIVSKNAMMTNIQYTTTIILAVICGLVWFQMKYDEDSVTDKSGFIFFFMTYWFFLALFQGMMQFLPERDILMKERASGSYRLSAYFLSKILSELPIRLVMPFIFLAICYPMANMNHKPEIFFAIVGTQLLSALAGESVGLFIGTSTMDFEKAMMYATLSCLTLMLVGGYFVQNLPSFVHWIRYVSPFKYSFDACIQMEFDHDIPCSNGEVLVQCGDGVDTVSGRVAVHYLGATQSISFNVGMLIVFIVFFRLIAYLALRFMPHNHGGRK